MTEPLALSRAERNRVQLRNDIIQAAFEEFSVRGYHQTAISDIAKRLGIGHGTFYRHFENKRDILEHVITDLSTRIVAELGAENAPSAVHSLEEYREQTARLAKRLTGILVENPKLLRMIFLESTSIDPQMTQRILQLFEYAANLAAAYMENGVRLGYFRKDLDTGATGYAVIGLIMTGAIRYLSAPDDRDGMKRTGEAIQRLLVDGVANREPPVDPPEATPPEPPRPRPRRGSSAK